MSATARPPVMHDVARRAGVSHQTVSRVLNDQPNVRPETRARVAKAITELGYRPNPLARGLVTRRSGLIGVISFDTRLFGPASTLCSVEEAARAAGYGVIVISVELEPDQLTDAVERITTRGVDGIIVIAPSVSAARTVRSLTTSVPVVALEAGYASDVPLVSIDQHAGARLATEHLLALGHRNVWHVAGPADWLEAQERIEGWRETLSDAGITTPPVISGDWSPRSGFVAADHVVADPSITAVFAANDQMALGLLCGLSGQGLRVPADVSVVGFDDIPEAEYLIPSLTTVRQDFDEMGRLGLQTLVGVLRQDTAQPHPPRIAPTLTLRSSTAAPSHRSPTTVTGHV